MSVQMQIQVDFIKIVSKKKLETVRLVCQFQLTLVVLKDNYIWEIKSDFFFSNTLWSQLKQDFV